MVVGPSGCYPVLTEDDVGKHRDDDAPDIAPPAEKPKLSVMYIIYMDDAPLLVTESWDDEDTVLEQFEAGIQLPEGRKFDIMEVYDAPENDLQRIKLIMELRTGLFSMQQIALALRAGKSNILIPTAQVPH